MNDVRKICFFSVGFAFNRLIRMKFYERIFPNDVELILLTTDRYKGSEEKNYQKEWDLKRAKVHVLPFSHITFPFKLRKFMKENNVDRIVNLGNRGSMPLFLFATAGASRDFIMSMMGWVPSFKEACTSLRHFRALLFFYFFSSLSKKVISNDYKTFIRFTKDSKFMDKLLVNPKKVSYLPAVVDTNLFKPKSQSESRKKLKLPMNKKIVLFVGRVNWGKCSDILVELIKSNKDVLFVVIGRVMDDAFAGLQSPNLIHHSSKSSSELVDFYNAADLGFFLQRSKAGGLGLTAEESLACGLPAIVRKEYGIKVSSKALIQTEVSLENAQKSVRDYLSMNSSERKKLREIARNLAVKEYSQSAWSGEYIKELLS